MEQAECTYRSGYLYPTDTRRRILSLFLISYLARRLPWFVKGGGGGVPRRAKWVRHDALL